MRPLIPKLKLGENEKLILQEALKHIGHSVCSKITQTQSSKRTVIVNFPVS